MLGMLPKLIKLCFTNGEQENEARFLWVVPEAKGACVHAFVTQYFAVAAVAAHIFCSMR